MIAKNNISNIISAKIYNIILYVIYFLFIYSLQFTFVPGAIGTRVMLGVVGFALAFLELVAKVKRTGKLEVSRQWFLLLTAAAMIVIVSLSANVINSTSDRFFTKYIISLTLIFFAAYFVIRATKVLYIRITFELVARFFIYCVVIQMIIAVVMFVIPAFRDLMLGLLFQQDYSLAIFDQTEGFRIIGFGSQFFGAGITNGFALMLIAALYKSDNYSISHGKLFLFFILITVVGSMMARTTIIGTAMAVGLLVIKSNFRSFKISYKAIRVFRMLILLTISIIVVIVLLPNDIKEQGAMAFEYGFEMFYNYFETGTMSTESTDQLSRMYNVYPDELKTWVIGDGLWLRDQSDPNSYYAGVDVGFTRMIFYFGIIGTIFYILFQWFMLNIVNGLTNGRYKVLVCIVFIYIFVLNFKGFADITQMVALWLFLDYSKPKYKLSNE